MCIRDRVKGSNAADSIRSVFCPRCARVGPRKNCEACAELRKTSPLLPKAKRTKIKVIKVGSEKVDWKGFEKHLGFVVRGADDIKRAYHVEGNLSLIHISEPTRLLSISYAVFC